MIISEGTTVLGFDPPQSNVSHDYHTLAKYAQMLKNCHQKPMVFAYYDKDR